VQKMSDLLTVKEAGELLGMHKLTIYKHIKDGTIKASRLGKNIRISKTELLKTMNKTGVANEAD